MRNVKIIVIFLVMITLNQGYAQTSQRIYISSITPSSNTGQDYSPWLNDNMDSFITNVWSATNNQYIDVKLKLQQKALITKVSLYDYQGTFADHPASIYAINGSQSTLLGTFTGMQYMQWVDIIISNPVLADTIVIHKYANDLPEKIKIYGIPDSTGSGSVTTTPVTIIPDTPVAVNTSPTGTITGKIPIDSNRWYQLDNTSNGLGGLFDGNLISTVQTGYGKIITNYDAYYPVLPGEVITLDSIKFYDGQGSNTSAPFTLYVINSQWQRTAIATFTGTQYNVWVGPNPNSSVTSSTRFRLPASVTDIKYLVINTSGSYPNEMQLYGTYTYPTAITPVPAKTIQLKQMFGVNGFEWNFENPNSPLAIDTARLRAAKSFTALRHYMDWQKLENTEGSYTFNPCYSGGWNYDTLYATCKADSIVVLADLKTIPSWMISTYPSGSQDAENVPVKYGYDFSSPSSYLGQAKVAFQFAARYGNNHNVSSSLLSVNSTPRWANDPPNVIKKGLNLVKYIECDNERDKWWKGRKAYQTGREYAANLSAFYDGNKNTMGAGAGVKNADSTMQVVMSGVATVTTDYLRGMIDWCKEFRGYKADGSVNLCWDVINYHMYANNSTSQSSTATSGAAPEVAHSDSIALNFIKVAHQYAADIPVWVTETGYDINQGSVQKSYAIGTKTALQTQADWILRTALLYARTGVERVFYYEMYDDNISSTTKFASSGLINSDHSRKPAADYLYQVNKLLGNYTYQSTLCTNPYVDRYVLNGQSAYALTMGTQTGATTSYTLSLGTAKVKVYKPAAGQDTMSMQVINTVNGNLQLTVTETPQFVVPVNSNTQSLRKAEPDSIESNEDFIKSISIYPNPAKDYTTLQINNNDNQPIEIGVYSMAGQLFQSRTVEKTDALFKQQIALDNLPIGMYMLVVKQGTSTIAKPIIKSN